MDYKNKIITVGQALDMVKSGMRIALGDATVEPQAFLENIHTIADRVKDVELTNCLGLRSYPFMENSAYRDSFILRPGEEKKLRRALNKETTTLGILAGYRNLGKSVWRATYKIPDPPEKSWYSRFMPKKKVELDAGIEQSAIVIKERDE